VHFAHVQLAKNGRQPYAVSRYAGVQATAHSWGPGRAVARLPRKHGGIGAYANFARGGHMFAPTTVVRRWQRKCNLNIRRYAVASAVAATAVTPMVEARGHRVANVKTLPIVVDCGDVRKTRDALKIISALGAMPDVERVKASRTIRAGVGKMRNRRYKQAKGPLVVYGNEDVSLGFRNVPGVDLCHVSHLNLLQLAPGSHPGRLTIWTKSAFASLDDVYKAKKNYRLPSACIKNDKINEVIMGEAMSKTFRPRRLSRPVGHKVDPFESKEAMEKLNPSA